MEGNPLKWLARYENLMEWMPPFKSNLNKTNRLLLNLQGENSTLEKFDSFGLTTFDFEGGGEKHRLEATPACACLR
jgi:hypothetical protein